MTMTTVGAPVTVTTTMTIDVAHELINVPQGASAAQAIPAINLQQIAALMTSHARIKRPPGVSAEVVIPATNLLARPSTSEKPLNQVPVLLSAYPANRRSAM